MDLKIVEWFQSNRNDVFDQFFGLVFAVAIQESFKRILPYLLEESIFTLILDAIRYFLLTIWLTLGAPYVFKLIIKEARVD